MEDNKIIVIVVVLILALGIGIYCLGGINQSYGPGTYTVGEDISPGTYNRTGQAMVLQGDFVSAGDIMVIKNTPGAKVEVDSGELIKINDSTDYTPSGTGTYFTGSVSQ